MSIGPNDARRCQLGGAHCAHQPDLGGTLHLSHEAVARTPADGGAIQLGPMSTTCQLHTLGDHDRVAGPRSDGLEDVTLLLLHLCIGQILWRAQPEVTALLAEGGPGNARCVVPGEATPILGHPGTQSALIPSHHRREVLPEEEEVGHVRRPKTTRTFKEPHGLIQNVCEGRLLLRVNRVQEKATVAEHCEVRVHVNQCALPRPSSLMTVVVLGAVIQLDESIELGIRDAPLPSQPMRQCRAEG
mmetsp:Transcript_25838/g.67724  ORF Transcript_25838/g.67724 Transcript_25838/m.67724 type:complete len:244 (-) Transcript_25838:1099-1830(-)